MEIQLKLNTITLDKNTQCRAEIDQQTVNDYVEALTEGVVFPPVEVYGTREQSWVGDGWHRILAHRKAKFVEINAILHPGGELEAIIHALGANETHGKRRTIADKRKAVAVALARFPGKSNRQIGQYCHVSHTFVADQRIRNTPPTKAPAPKRTTAPSPPQPRFQEEREQPEVAALPPEPDIPIPDNKVFQNAFNSLSSLERSICSIQEYYGESGHCDTIMDHIQNVRGELRVWERSK